MFANTYPPAELVADLTAEMLLEIKAVHFQAEKPYTLTSGLASPVYIDCRKLISYPRIRSAVMDFAVATLYREVGFEQFDAVAGGETAGIPFAAWIADKMNLPMQYVRKKAKGFGRDAQIEGDIHERQRVLLVEDLTTDGGSKIRFCEALRKAGAEVNDAIVIFYYDMFADVCQTLEQNHGLRLHWLATWHDVLRVSRRKGYFDSKTLDEVEAFLAKPLEWSVAHGGAGEIAK